VEQAVVNEEPTTVAIERYLSALGDEKREREQTVRHLLDLAARRLQRLSHNLLQRSYPRLTQGPLNLRAEELLSAVVERLLKALRQAQPKNARQFFALANKHMCWELNELARRLDTQSLPGQLPGDVAALPDSSHSCLGPNAVRVLTAIENLPEDEREVFSLIRIQEMSQVEVAAILGVATKTIQRRLNRALVLLTETLADMAP
jgi:RNA polymerase sigma-70 factor (ECF subfamily)